MHSFLQLFCKLKSWKKFFDIKKKINFKARFSGINGNLFNENIFSDLQLLFARNQCQCIKRLQCQIQKVPYKNCKFIKMLESQSRDLGPKMIFNSYLSRSSNLRLFSLTRNFDHQNARGIFDGNSWGLAPLEFFFHFENEQEFFPFLSSFALVKKFSV